MLVPARGFLTVHCRNRALAVPQGGAIVGFRSSDLMKRIAIIACLAVLLGISLWPAGPAAAADTSYRPAAVQSRSPLLPFPRSERTQSVWASAACWSESGAYCAWGEAGCLARDSQGQCLKLTDTCDRYCQRQCRTSGGPLLPLDF
jgi:hypothetical protein